MRTPPLYGGGTGGVGARNIQSKSTITPGAPPVSCTKERKAVSRYQTPNDMPQPSRLIDTASSSRSADGTRCRWGTQTTRSAGRCRRCSSSLRTGRTWPRCRPGQRRRLGCHRLPRLGCRPCCRPGCRPGCLLGCRPCCLPGCRLGSLLCCRLGCRPGFLPCSLPGCRPGSLPCCRSGFRSGLCVVVS